MSVYLDHNASSPMHAEVLDEMMPFLTSSAGNASSLHRNGRFLRSAIETARGRVAELVQAKPENIIFTSGGSEANNLAIKGFIPCNAESTIATSQIEHASILEPVKQAERAGCQCLYLPVNESGLLDVDVAQQHIGEFKPDLLSLQMANNETGVIQPLARVTQMAHYCGSLVHTDAIQAAGKIDIDFCQLGVNLMTLSAHKFQGPQGVGALITDGQALISPLISGGPQESGRRAGTENTALLVGFGKAAELARINLSEKRAYLLELRRFFERELRKIPGVRIFGENVDRLPNTSYFSIPYYHGETLLMQLDKAGFSLASGSACHSEVTQPSHVLSAMGIDDDLALNAVRVSFGMENTHQQVEQLILKLNELINQLPAIMRQATG